MLIKIRKAQTTLEYASLIAVVVGALVAMQVFIKRGVQGRYRSAANDIGEQYSPRNTTGTQTVNISSTSVETVASGTTHTTSDTTQDISKSENIADMSSEYWGN